MVWNYDSTAIKWQFIQKLGGLGLQAAFSTILSE